MFENKNSNSKPTWIWFLVELILEDYRYAFAAETLSFVILLADAHLSAPSPLVQNASDNSRENEHRDDNDCRQHERDQVIIVAGANGRGIVDWRHFGTTDTNVLAGAHLRHRYLYDRELARLAITVKFTLQLGSEALVVVDEDVAQPRDLAVRALVCGQSEIAPGDCGGVAVPGDRE